MHPTDHISPATAPDVLGREMLPASNVEQPRGWASHRSKGLSPIDEVSPERSESPETDQQQKKSRFPRLRRVKTAVKSLFTLRKRSLASSSTFAESSGEGQKETQPRQKEQESLRHLKHGSLSLGGGLDKMLKSQEAAQSPRPPEGSEQGAARLGMTRREAAGNSMLLDHDLQPVRPSTATSHLIAGDFDSSTPARPSRLGPQADGGKGAKAVEDASQGK
jgi:hypothetical protein